MNTQSLRQFIFAPDSSGMNVTALCFCAFGGVSFVAMAVICILRLTAGFYSVAGAYFVMAVLSAGLAVYSVKCIRNDNIQALTKMAYPLTAGMFVYGLTV